jgi:hypothetical protein
MRSVKFEAGACLRALDDCKRYPLLQSLKASRLQEGDAFDTEPDPCRSATVHAVSRHSQVTPA